jgi:outer membrane protein assembly factor BamB
MKTMPYSITVASLLTLAAAVPVASAQDWPQWRGPNRDAKAADFKAPKTWPKELTQKWKVAVGDGAATPSLVGDKLYVFSRQGGSEVLRCLDTATGKELWQDKYDALGATGAAASFSGPRCSPTVAEGKVVTFGVRGMLSCLDAETGKVLWRKDDFGGSVPRFFTSASPIVSGGLCVAQVGGGDKGGVVAYDLKTGEEKWRWTGDSPAYASPVLMKVEGTPLVIAETETKLLALNLADGKLAWETPFAVQRQGYNAATPIVDGQTLIYSGSGRGTTAVRLEKSGDTYAAKPLWKNDAISVQFNSPVLKEGMVYGLTAGNDLFCLNAADGKTVWTAPAAGAAAPAPAPATPAPAAENPPPASGAAPDTAPSTPVVAVPPPGGPGRGGPGGPGGGRGGGGRGGGMGGGRGGAGYGSVVDAGSVLIALTPASQLIAFSPGGTYAEVARIKVADSPTQAYPILSGSRIFTKDQDSVTLWSVE